MLLAAGFQASCATRIAGAVWQRFSGLCGGLGTYVERSLIGAGRGGRLMISGWPGYAHRAFAGLTDAASLAIDSPHAHTRAWGHISLNPPDFCVLFAVESMQ